MNKHQDISKIDWLMNHYNLDKANYVSGILPPGFETYLKVFNPCEFG